MPTFPAGHVPTADEFEQLTDQIDSLTAPGWFDYTTVAPSGGSAFALTATTTNPTQGNSTYSAHMRRSASGDIVFVRIYIVIGSTFSAGSGVYQLGLPYAMSSGAIGTVGPMYILDNGTALRAGVAIQGTSTSTLQLIINGAVTGVTHSSPQAWATGDEIRLSFAYEPA